MAHRGHGAPTTRQITRNHTGPSGPPPHNGAISRSLSSFVVHMRATMTQDSASRRVFKINELTRFIAGHLVLISRQSTVNFACACQCLEIPVLSALWETQLSLHTLLMVFPEGTWCIGGTGWERTVRGMDFPLEKSNVEVSGCHSSRSWWNRCQRLGTESNATLLGCFKSTWIGGRLWGRTLSRNYVLIRLLAGGSQR